MAWVFDEQGHGLRTTDYGIRATDGRLSVTHRPTHRARASDQSPQQADAV